MLVELGNDKPQDTVSVVDPETGETRTVRKAGKYPCVAYLSIPDYNVGRTKGLDRLPDESDDAFEARDAADIAAQEGDRLYSMPDEHDDDIFAQHEATAHIADALAGIDDEKSKSAVRRAMIDGQFADPSGVKGLPDHAALSAVVHPGGFWQAVATPGTSPSWVRCDHPGMQKMLADYYGCPEGAPSDLEDHYLTRSGTGMYPPGASADPASSIKAMHTTYGRLNQALVMGGFGYLGTVGTGTASSATTLTGSAETGVSHASNDSAGQWLVVGPNASGTGSKVYGLIVSNTSGTTPVYTVDQWYNAAAPGGAVGTTPNATGFYQVVNGGPSAIFVALSTNTTAKTLTGTAGSADSPTISTALTAEFTTASSGLLRKIAPIGQSGATWTATPVFTATATDNGIGAQTVGTAASSPSIVATVGALVYMTLVSPTATLTATGDALTLTWTWTMT